MYGVREVFVLEWLPYQRNVRVRERFHQIGYAIIPRLCAHGFVFVRF